MGFFAFFTKKKIALNTGEQAERQAEHYLKAQGLIICERNYSIKAGEIDLIARDNNCIVFVEVRYRHNNVFGSAGESVTFAKQQKLRKAALCYLQQRGLSEKYACRFDVIALSATEPLDWIQNAF